MHTNTDENQIFPVVASRQPMSIRGLGIGPVRRGMTDLMIIDAGISFNMFTHHIDGSVRDYMAKRHVRFIPTHRRKRVLRAAQRQLQRFQVGASNPINFDS